MQTRQVLYWLITGMLLGFGLIGVLTIGLPFLLIGLVMVLYGCIRLGTESFWMTLVGFGALPAIILFIDIVTSPPPCTDHPLTLPPNASSVSCGSIPNSYFVMAICFGLIALAGAVWPLLQRFRRAH